MMCETMGGKTREHWESVMERIRGLIGNLDQVRNIALAEYRREVADRSADDIDALIDALVVVDWEYTQHFGEPPEATKRVTGTMVQ